MRKLLTLLIGLAAVMLAAYWYLNGGFEQRQGASAPKTRLDSVRESTKKWEADAEQRAKDSLKAAEEK
jgi:hypothetical protein